MKNMAKKRKTLPKNFNELIETKNIDALIAVFDTCEINAYNHGFDKSTALHTFGIPDELVRWLVEHGADINFRNHYEKTPLHHQAGYWCGNVALFIDLGADISVRDIYKNTPLHQAAHYCRVQSVRELIAYGADVHAEDDRNNTPLADTLSSGVRGGIAPMAEVAEILLNAGAKITPSMAESVERIGEDFEFRRADYSKERLPETEAGLAKLYELFNVIPVARRKTYDGVSPIAVPNGTWDEQHEILWQLLVPSRGQTQTLQGEVIRLSGKLAREIMDNGGINWDDEFRKMLFALVRYLGKGNPLVFDELSEAEKIVKRLKNGNGDDEPERLMELAVTWVNANPNPIPLDKTEYNR